MSRIYTAEPDDMSAYRAFVEDQDAIARAEALEQAAAVKREVREVVAAFDRVMESLKDEPAGKQLCDAVRAMEEVKRVFDDPQEEAIHILHRANYWLMHKPLREWGDKGDIAAGSILLNAAELIYEEMESCL